MRILSSAVILAVTLGVGCAKSDTAQTTPPAQGGQTAAAPAPAAAPAGRAGGAPAAAPAGRQGGAAAAPVTIAEHAATMKQISVSNGTVQKAIKSNDLMAAATEAQNLTNLFATIERFYTQRSKPDAVKLAQTARSGATDAAAAAKAGDQMKAQMAAASTGGTCTQCHKMYREGDGKTTPYAFNAASGITPP
jgi:hypothetical protein